MALSKVACQLGWSGLDAQDANLGLGIFGLESRQVRLIGGVGGPARILLLCCLPLSTSVPLGRQLCRWMMPLPCIILLVRPTAGSH